jgi:hypothetical protein
MILVQSQAWLPEFFLCVFSCSLQFVALISAPHRHQNGSLITMKIHIYIYIYGWWFGSFFICPYVGNNHPNWLIFFRGVGIPPTSNPILWKWSSPKWWSRYIKIRRKFSRWMKVLKAGVFFARVAKNRRGTTKRNQALFIFLYHICIYISYI